MNILFVDQFSDPGGAQLCLMDLLPEVQRRGWTAHVMAPGNGPLLKHGIAHSLPLRNYSNGYKTPVDALRFAADIPRAAAAIRRVARCHGIDLVYVNGPRALPAVAGVDCPVIFHAHSVVEGVLTGKLIAWSLRRTRATVIGASKFVARKFPGAQVIYNGVPDLSRGPRTFGNQPPRVGILGRIAPEKGHLDFIRAARELGGGVKFVVYGDSLFAAPGYAGAIREAATGANVEFRGWTGDVAGALNELDILAVPSGPSEAATRVIMEAFSAGTPVVAYRAGGIPELVEDGRTGVLTDSLAGGIRSLLADPDRMTRLSEAGRSEWAQRFRIERFIANVCDTASASQAHGRSRSRK